MFGGRRRSSRWSARGASSSCRWSTSSARLHLSARRIDVSLPDAVTKQGIKVGGAGRRDGQDRRRRREHPERRGAVPEDRDEQIEPIVKNVLEGSLRSIVGHAHGRGAQLRPPEVPAGGPGARPRRTSRPRACDRQLHDPGDPRRSRLHGPHRPAGDGPPRAGRPHGQGAGRPGGRRPGGRGEQIKLNAQRDVSLRQAEAETQIAAAEAKAAQAGPLAQAEAQQEVVRRQTELAQLEAARTPEGADREHRPPGRGRGRRPRSGAAEGEKLARIAAAQAEAERVKLAGQAEAAVQVTKGEAQARVTAVNAEAKAKQTTLEGNAEAGITFTKGEAEAKALALRADAYRQFNEAAIISTVFSVLPEIVRAAAEPMAAIDSLTVLSTDGASDVVKNATRTVTEASATVKGLTGIDIPQLLNNAVGSTPTASRRAQEPAPAGPRRGGRAGGDEGSGGGSGSTPRPGGGGTGPKRRRAGRAPPAPRQRCPPARAPRRLDRAPAAPPTPEQRFEAASTAIGRPTGRRRRRRPRSGGLSSGPAADADRLRHAGPATSARIAAGRGRAAGLDESSTLSEPRCGSRRSCAACPGSSGSAAPGCATWIGAVRGRCGRCGARPATASTPATATSRSAEAARRLEQRGGGTGAAARARPRRSARRRSAGADAAPAALPGLVAEDRPRDLLGRRTGLGGPDDAGLRGLEVGLRGARRRDVHEGVALPDEAPPDIVALSTPVQKASSPIPETSPAKIPWFRG